MHEMSRAELEADYIAFNEQELNEHLLREDINTEDMLKNHLQSMTNQELAENSFQSLQSNLYQSILPCNPK